MVYTYGMLNDFEYKQTIRLKCYAGYLYAISVTSSSVVELNSISAFIDDGLNQTLQ